MPCQCQFSGLAAPNKMNDLQAGSGREHARFPIGTANYYTIELNGDLGRLEPESGYKTGHGLAVRDVVRFAVNDHFHICKYRVSRPVGRNRVDTPFG